MNLCQVVVVGNVVKLYKVYNKNEEIKIMKHHLLFLLLLEVFSLREFSTSFERCTVLDQFFHNLLTFHTIITESHNRLLVQFLRLRVVDNVSIILRHFGRFTGSCWWGKQAKNIQTLLLEKCHLFTQPLLNTIRPKKRWSWKLKAFLFQDSVRVKNRNVFPFKKWKQNSIILLDRII